MKTKSRVRQIKADFRINLFRVCITIVPIFYMGKLFSLVVMITYLLALQSTELYFGSYTKYYRVKHTY